MVVNTLAQNMAISSRYLARETDRPQSRCNGMAIRIESPTKSAVFIIKMLVANPIPKRRKTN